MASVVEQLHKRGLISPPSWLPRSVIFEGVTGSMSYGCNSPGSSDTDLVGVCIPKKSIVFPHTEGHIPGFGRGPEKFGVWQQHHVTDSGKEYDFAIYNIVHYFQLCMENNPNMVDTLFLADNCIRKSSPTYDRIRENRRLFLHKGCWHKFRGYAFSQLSKIKKGANRQNPKRQASIDKYGFDVKFAYHVVRLLLECEQILEYGDLILDRDREMYKSIRRGEWTFEDIKDLFDSKEKKLQELYDAKGGIPHSPDEGKIRALLMECLEMHFGSMDKFLGSQEREPDSGGLLRELEALLDRHKNA